MSKSISVGFIGNPNCGKTTLFNAFTGANLKVANWPGVTVEKKEGKTSYEGCDFKLIDLPGIYSLTSYTMEETVSRNCILSDEVDVIVNVVDASSLERNLYLTLQLIELGKPVILALNMMDIVEERGMEIDLHRLPEMLGNIPVVTFSTQQYNWKMLILKRMMDIAGALAGLLITGVVTLFLAPPLLIESPGPLVFSQMRVGKNGRFFKIYKFRSMYRDAEARKKELESQNEMSGFKFKMKDDPRITKVGKFIRKTSIDELPQFFNVLKGDMSLVGTRPPTVEEFRQYEAHQKRRLSAKPGITGLWQVSGRNAISDFEEVVKLDVQYIDNWSIGLDIKILLKTIGVVFKKEGE